MLAVGLVLSLAIGLSLGLLGGGGSILTVPVLHYALGLGVHEAIAASLLVVGVTSGIALVSHARAGRVRWRTGLVFGAASMATAFAGGRLGALLPGGVLIAAFALVMVSAGIAMLVRSPAAQAVATVDHARLGRIVATGLGVGLVTGVLGAGGGFVIVPALTLLGGLAVREAVGTSLLVIAMNSFAGLAGGALSTPIHGRIVAAVTALAIAGSLLGSRLGRRLPAHHLQRAFGGFILVIAAIMLVRELA
ncbi:MAG TPA: sulfite exporter TauE/SafE family protein [Kofleriaceae bacterium]|nr:sulfite exporter TauE/SafE family protein [Kofleriaceae bacterium]